METDGYAPNPTAALLGDWTGTSAPGGGGVAEEGGATPWGATPYPLAFQVSLTAVLLLELLLGCGSNLAVLALYCSQPGLVDSASNMVTVNLHVLDAAVCALCLPLTLAVVLLPPGPGLAPLCCLHEACVTFASVATPVNVLVVSADRYDISVRPANRLLTPRRAALLLAAVWAASTAVFFVPFLQADFLSDSDDGDAAAAWRNRTLLCAGGQGGQGADPAVYYHLLLQVPVFAATVGVMLFTYSRILRALSGARTGARLKKKKKRREGRRRSVGGALCRGRRRKPRKRAGPGETEGGRGGGGGDRRLTPPPFVPSATPTPTATSPPALSSSATMISPTGAAAGPAPVGVQASVSAIVALRRAVRRHRDRRERQRRVFRMSLLIIASFLGCWAPLSAANVLILWLGPGDALVGVRLWFLALAYGSTVAHPLLYGFTRQKLRRALRAKVAKRAVSLLQVDPSPGSTVIHNSWVEPRKGGGGGGGAGGRAGQLEAGGADAAGRCLAEAPRDQQQQRRRLDTCVTLPMPNQ